MSGSTASQAIKHLTPEEQRALTERRRERRIACDFLLSVAEYDGLHLPYRTDFEERLSRDISRRGMSFFAPLPPASDHVVLMMGSNPNTYYITARIVRYQEGFWQRKRQFVVGCQFTGQVLIED